MSLRWQRHGVKLFVVWVEDWVLVQKGNGNFGPLSGSIMVLW